MNKDNYIYRPFLPKKSTATRYEILAFTVLFCLVFKFKINSLYTLTLIVLL